MNKIIITRLLEILSAVLASTENLFIDITAMLNSELTKSLLNSQFYQVRAETRHQDTTRDVCTVTRCYVVS